MVLSNKKLKQKLRSTLTESLIASMSEPHSNTTTNSIKSDPESKTHSLNSNTQKPRLTKREIRRKTRPLSDSNVVDSSSNGNKFEVQIEGGEVKKKNKRKRDVVNGVAGSIENLETAKDSNANNDDTRKKTKTKKEEKGDEAVMENGEVVKKSKAKKKNKKKKAKAKVEMEEEKKVDEVGNGGDQGVVEPMKIDDRVLDSVHNNEENVDAETKVYVGGIPYYSTEDDIRSYFESCGTITEIDCMKFPDTGKFRGIAIIRFKTAAAAKRALAFDESDMGGFFLKVQPYRTTRQNKAFSDFSPEIVKGYNRIYIGNLSWDITEDDLKKFFCDFKISSIRLGKDKETGEFRGYAHIDFSDSLYLTMAMKLDQQFLCGRPVKISCAVPRKAGDSKTVDSKKVGESKNTDTMMKEVEIKSLNVVKAEEYKEVAVATDVTTTVPGIGKIKRRTCYECGEKGHLSSACPAGASKTVDSKKVGESKNTDTIMKEVEIKSLDVVKEEKYEKIADVAAAPLPGIGKIKRRTCYECGEKGHLSSACPAGANKTVDSKKVGESKNTDTIMKEIEIKSLDVVKEEKYKEIAVVADVVAAPVPGIGKIKRRTCYECGEKGHLSLACPNKKLVDSADVNAS